MAQSVGGSSSDSRRSSGGDGSRGGSGRGAIQGRREPPRRPPGIMATDGETYRNRKEPIPFDSSAFMTMFSQFTQTIQTQIEISNGNVKTVLDKVEGQSTVLVAIGEGTGGN